MKVVRVSVAIDALDQQVFFIRRSESEDVVNSQQFRHLFVGHISSREAGCIHVSSPLEHFDVTETNIKGWRIELRWQLDFHFRRHQVVEVAICDWLDLIQAANQAQHAVQEGEKLFQALKKVNQWEDETKQTTIIAINSHLDHFFLPQQKRFHWNCSQEWKSHFHFFLNALARFSFNWDLII